MKSQKQLIKEHLLKKRSVTVYEAFKIFGCTKLSTRISELRNDLNTPMNIVGKWVKHVDGRRNYLRYSLKN